ncbi:unnamed protein product [Schistosoma turkestanicum]|nr:unnamed protein product [Schistosoma turkestanicum]
MDPTIPTSNYYGFNPTISIPNTLNTHVINACQSKPIQCSSQENIHTNGISDDDDHVASAAAGGAVSGCGGAGGESVFDEELWSPLTVHGYLSKWTNLLHGWQERYFILSDGLLTYYRNSDDLNCGSRGSIRIKNAYIKIHEYDECRFEVRVGDVIWYLRGLNQNERYAWITAMEQHRLVESGYESEKTLPPPHHHHHGSLLSLNSTYSPSIHSTTSSFKRHHYGLKEKLTEMETFKEILCKQVDSLQAYFDTCHTIVQHGEHDNLEKWLNTTTTDTTNSNIMSSTNKTHLTRSSSSSSSASSACSSSSPSYYIKDETIDSTVDDDDDDDEDEDDEGIQSERRLRKRINNNRNQNNNNNNNNNKLLNIDKLTSDQCSTLRNSTLETLSTYSANNIQTTSTVHQSDPSTHSPKSSSHPSTSTTGTNKDSNNTNLRIAGGGGGGFFSRLLSFRNFGNTQTAQTVTESDNKDETTTVTTTVATPPSINKSTLIQSMDSMQESSRQQHHSNSRYNDLRRILQQHGSHAIDFKDEAHMFKAITTGILTNLSQSIDLMQQHEENWRKRLEREIDKRRRLEEMQKAMTFELLQLRNLVGLSSAAITQTTTSTTVHYQPTHSRVFSYGSSLDFKHFTADHLKESLLKCNQITTATTTSTNNNNNVGIGDNRGDSLNTLNTVNDNIVRLVGPDYEEGLNSPMHEEEFFDTIDAELDKMEQNEVRLAALKTASEAIRSARAMPSNHPLYYELNKIVKMHMKNFTNTQIFDYSSKLCSNSMSSSTGTLSSHIINGHSHIHSQETTGSDEIPENWRIVVQDGDMIVFRRELISDDGVVLDPLQAIHVVHGVTAREMCTYFWDVRYRMEWEFTVDHPPAVLEVCGDDTVVTHQIYKRVWPTTQRDSLFWSHICPVNPIQTNSSPTSNSPTDSQNTNNDHVNPTSIGTTAFTSNGSLPSQSIPSNHILDGWMVVNMSTDYLSDKIPPSPSPTIRLGLEVVLFCRTEILSNDSSSSEDFKKPNSSHHDDDDDNGQHKLTRDQLCTRLVYMANINPGGWVPAAGLRTLAQREYPRFLKRFSAYVKEQTQNKQPLF